MITLEIGGRPAVVISVQVAIKLLSLGAELRPLARGSGGVGSTYSHILVPPADDAEPLTESELWVVSAATIRALRFLGVPVVASTRASNKVAAKRSPVRSGRSRALIYATSGLGPLGLSGLSIPG